MRTLILYDYKNGEYTINSIEKPDCEYTERYRLVADEGKVLTKDEENLYAIIDIDKSDLFLWKEIDKPETFGLRPEL